MSLLTRRRWRPYPYQWAELNRNSDFARGLVFLTMPGSPFNRRELVSGRSPTLVGYGTISTPHGDASVLTAGAGGLNYGSYNAIPDGSQTYSALALANAAATGVTSCLFSQYDNTNGSNPQIEFMLNADGGTNASAGRMGFIEYFGSTKATAQTDTTIVDGNWHVYGLVRYGSGTIRPALFKDAVDVTLSGIPATGSISGATIGPVYACGAASRNFAVAHPVVCVAVWNRAFANDEVMYYSLLMRNRPDSFLHLPSRRSIFDFGKGSVAPPTGVARSQGIIIG